MVKVKEVMSTKAGPTPHLEAEALAERVNWLCGGGEGAGRAGRRGGAEGA